jgi:hypothetical protein
MPAGSTVPAGGVYTNVPGVFALAFSCVALSAVPVPMLVGAGQVMVGVAWFTVSALVPEEALKVDEPAKDALTPVA